MARGKGRTLEDHAGLAGLPTLPVLPGRRVIRRDSIESDVDDRLGHPIDPGKEDGYGSSRRREWDGKRHHTRQGPPLASRVTSREVTNARAYRPLPASADGDNPG